MSLYADRSNGNKTRIVIGFGVRSLFLFCFLSFSLGTLLYAQFYASAVSQPNIAASPEAVALSSPSSLPANLSGVELLGITPGKTKFAQLKGHPIFDHPAKKEYQSPFYVMTYKIPDVPDLESIQLMIRGGTVDGMVVYFTHPRTTADARASFASVIQGVRPVVFADNNGIFRETYPEKGFSFILEKDAANPNIPSSNVLQITLEKENPEHYLLRAAQEMQNSFSFRSSVLICRDAETVLKLQPQNAEAHGILAQTAFYLNEFRVAQLHLNEALKINSVSPSYHLLAMNIMDRLGLADEGLEYFEKNGKYCTGTPYMQAERFILYGNFLRDQVEPNYDGAISAHRKSIEILSPLVRGDKTDLVLLSKQLLLRSYLALALDIVQKPWGNPDDVQKGLLWLTVADQLVTEMGETMAYPGENRMFLVLNAMKIGKTLPFASQLDPYIQALPEMTESLAREQKDPLNMQSIYWRGAKGLVDAWEIAEQREDAELAATCARSAYKYLEPFCKEASQRVYDTYGIIDYDFGMTLSDDPLFERETGECFERALRKINDLAATGSLYENGENGIRLVNIGKYYWLHSQQERGYELTCDGIEALKAAVSADLFEEMELVVPLRNAAAMARELGEEDAANSFAEHANQIDPPEVIPEVIPEETPTETEQAEADPSEMEPDEMEDLIEDNFSQQVVSTDDDLPIMETPSPAESSKREEDDHTMSFFMGSEDGFTPVAEKVTTRIALKESGAGGNGK